MSSLLSTRGRRLTALAFVGVVAMAVVSCTADPSTGGTTTTTTVPAAQAILSTTSGPAGSFVDVAPPDEHCTSPDQPARSLHAVLTIPVTGVVVAQEWQYPGGVFSEYASPDAFVHLRVPPATTPGTYLVYLSCLGYLDSYAYAPVAFTVTPS